MQTVSISDEPTQPISHDVSDVSSSQTSMYPSKVNFNLLIENLYTAVLLLLPFFFLPYTADAINLNKTYLIIFAAVVSLVLYFANALQTRRLAMASLESYAIPALLLIGAIVSTILSTNRRISLYGTFDNYSASVLFILALFVLFFVSANVKLNSRKLLNSLVAGVTISTILSLLVFYGVRLPGLGQLPGSFSFAGANASLIGLQALSVILAFHLYAGTKTKNKKQTIFYSLAFILNAVFLIVSANMYGLLIAIIGLIYLVSTSKVKYVSGARNALITFLLISFLLGFVNHFGPTKELLNLTDYVNSPRLPIAESWLVSASSVREFPVAGTGLGTFITDFTRYRPASLNATDMWEIRFHNPYNDLFLWLATAGLVGVFAYMGFWALVLRESFGLISSGDDNNFASGIIVVMSFLALMLLGNNIILYALLFIILGSAAQRKSHSSFVVNSSSVIYTFNGLALLILGLFGYLAYMVYSGQVHFKNSIFAADANQLINSQIKALNFDQYESVYRRNFAITNLSLARQLSAQENLDQTGADQVNSLVSTAVLEVRRLTELVNPLDVANWEARGVVYNALIGVAENADQFAIDSYSNAINLEPSNPKLWVELGSIYHRREDYQNAARAFVQATQLKNDYANAHYNLAFTLKAAGGLPNLQQAVVQLEIVSRLVPADSPDFENVQANLEVFREEAVELAQQQAQAQAQQLVEAQNPEDIRQSGVATEPLVGPAEKESFGLQPQEGLDITSEQLDPETSEGLNNPTDENEEAPLSKPPVE